MEVTPAEALPGLAREDLTARKDEFTRKRQSCLDAAAILSGYSDEKPAGMLSGLFSAGPDEISESEYDAIAAKEEELLCVASRAAELDKRITDNNVSLVRTDAALAALKPWSGCPVPLSYDGTENTRVFSGTFPAAITRERLLTSIAGALPETEAVDAEVWFSVDNLTGATVICLKADADRVEDQLRAMGFSFPADPPSVPAGEEIKNLENKAVAMKADNKDCAEELKALAASLPDLKRLADHYTILSDADSAIEKAVSSGEVFIVSGYVPHVRAEKLKNAVESRFDAAVSLYEPTEDQDVPVLLKNNGFAKPLEGITEMYSLPGKNDIDPTFIMSFFYYFFFGMMLSDAGYGLLISIATGLFVFKAPKSNPMRDKAKMFLFCGLSTVFWGAMYGSWFGDLPVVVATNFFGKEKFSMALWVDPLNNLMHVLVVCFIFGLIHLFTGVFVNSINLIKRGQTFDGLCELIPTLTAVLGLAPMFFGLFTTVPEWMSKAGTPLLIVGAILVVLTAGRSAKSLPGKLGGGLYGVYNLVSGWLGDVLSYARLLALGLSTGVVAQVINMLGTLPQNKTLKLVMFIFVSILGHTANLFINLIGAYVHTNRLQYVEFFGKFYDGGGRAFQPLKVNAENFKISNS